MKRFENHGRDLYRQAGLISILLLGAIALPGRAQVNSGSDGHDGAFNPTTNTVINMADHPDGIYQYTSVNIPTNVTVTFVPNVNNSPVTWLIQSNCVINGIVNVCGQSANGGAVGGSGGPGGWPGGNGGNNPSQGQGPGGGTLSSGGSFGTQGSDRYGTTTTNSLPYGNSFLIPLLGGSGGGGCADLLSSYWEFYFYGGAGGGGGAIVIAASGLIQISGQILANGGAGNSAYFSPGGYVIYSGGGSGGGVRLVAANISGGGVISAAGNFAGGGSGRVRIDAFQNSLGGTINGVLTQGFQPIIIPAQGQTVQLSIASVAGVAVSSSPSGVLLNPDVIVPGQTVNPISIVVHCYNVPLNTSITVEVHPVNGSVVTATGLNNSGTQASSTATIPVTMPRGGGIILAKAVTALSFASTGSGDKYKSLAQTGWTADGQRFAKMEITASLGGKQQVVYLTESGKRYPLASL